MSYKVFHGSIRIQIALVKFHRLLGSWSFSSAFPRCNSAHERGVSHKREETFREQFLQITGQPKKPHFPYQPSASSSKSEPRCEINLFFFLEGSFSFCFVGDWEGKASQSCSSLVYFLMEQIQFSCTSAKNSPVNAQMQGWGGISLAALMSCCILQVMDCAMPLIGEHQAEDRQHITELVVSKMNQMLSKTPIPSPQRPTATQQPQVG